MLRAFLMRFEETDDTTPASGNNCAFAGTMTITDIKAERPDADSRTDPSCAIPPRPTSFEATATMTRTTGEQPDKPTSNSSLGAFSRPRRINLSTMTITKVQAEASDRDRHSAGARAVPYAAHTHA